MIDRTLLLRQQQAAFTRDRLLEAGRQVFSASGYLSATVDSLDGYLENAPVPDKTGARSRALLLEISTQRALALASASRLPVDNNSVLEALADMWFETLSPGLRQLP